MEHIYSVPTNFSTFVPLTVSEALTPYPHHYQIANNGYSGHGHDWSRLSEMWMSLVFAVIFYFCRTTCKKVIFKRLARALNIRGQKAEKFSYQIWLLLFYCTSSVYGYYTLHDKDWVAFPQGHTELYNLFANAPFKAPTDIQYYYAYSIGFYIAELIAIFVEPKRSDFFEYLLHHVVTLYLVVFSWIGYETKVGTYVLLIHDISDIPLCAAKIWHYIGNEIIVNINFGLFLISFIYMRLVCLPTLTYGLYFYSPKMRPLWMNMALLTFFVGVVLQCLHFFWFYLVLRVIYRLIRGIKGDVRSDDDEPETDNKKKAPKKSNGKKDEVTAAAAPPTVAAKKPASPRPKKARKED